MRYDYIRKGWYSVKKQAPVLARKQKNNEVNKKAIIWTVSVVAAVVVLTAVLIIVNG
jgi:hypothetical protein